MNKRIPTKFPSPETQRVFNEAITKIFPLSFESWTADRIAVNTGRDFQLDMGSSSKINFLSYLIAAHQKIQKIDTSSTKNSPSKSRKNRFSSAILNNVSVKQYFVQIDDIKIPKIPIMVNYNKFYMK